MIQCLLVKKLLPRHVPHTTNGGVNIFPSLPQAVGINDCVNTAFKIKCLCTFSSSAHLIQAMLNLLRWFVVGNKLSDTMYQVASLGNLLEANYVQ